MVVSSKTNEIWAPIVGYKEYYEVSNLGRIRSTDRMVKTKWRNGEDGEYFKPGRVLVPKPCSKDKKGHQSYLQVCLSVNNIKKYLMIHRAVAMAFVPNPENKTTVNHKDGNKHNNRADNLEWVSMRENALHSSYVLGSKRNTGVRCVETGEKFKVMKSAARFAGVSYSAISMAISGKRLTAGGYHWVKED